jgi:amino acid transporter
MWLFIMCWSAYGIEVCASFAPEYHDTKETRQGAQERRGVLLFVYIFLPLGLGGVSVRPATTAASTWRRSRRSPGTVVGGFRGGLSDRELILAMNTATADGGRALYGIARDDMTIKWFYHLNRFHVPARGMTVDMVVNIGLLLSSGRTTS